jgi:hypothetical protein
MMPLPFLLIACIVADIFPLLTLASLLLTLMPLLLRRLLLLSLPLLTHAVSLMATSFPSSDLQQHALVVAGLLLLAGAATSLASSLASSVTTPNSTELK